MQALTIMCSVENGGSPKGYRSPLQKSRRHNTCTRKGGKQPMFADLRCSGLQSHTSFPPWVELVCIPRIFCFSDSYQLSFLSSAERRTWPMPASCRQARARPSLSVVVLSSGESPLVSSTVQEQQVASCVQAFPRLEKEGRPLSRCRRVTQVEHIWLWPRARIFLHCCVPGSPVTECPMCTDTWTTTVRETYKTMKSDLCFYLFNPPQTPCFNIAPRKCSKHILVSSLLRTVGLRKLRQ